MHLSLNLLYSPLGWLGRKLGLNLAVFHLNFLHFLLLLNNVRQFSPHFRLGLRFCPFGVGHQILNLSYYLLVFIFFYSKCEVGIVFTEFLLSRVQLLIYFV